MKLKISSFCSGIGSFEQAIKNLGIEHENVFGCEIDKYARQTYLANHECNTMYHDMTKYDYEGEEWYSDINVSGIPCQAFSLAGKRLGELDPRGLLFYDFYRYVKNQQPKYFIIENVKGLLSDNEGKTFRNWIDLLGQSENGNQFFFPHEDSLLYNLHWQVLNTKDYGIPQNRERVFLVGIRNDLPNNFVFPKKIPLKLRLKDILEDEVDEKFYLSEKMLTMLDKHSERHNAKGTGFAVEFKNEDDIANCLRANASICPTDNILKIPTCETIKVFGNSRLNKTIQNNDLSNNDVQFIDAYNEKVYSDGTTNTISTRVDASNNSFVKVPSEIQVIGNYHKSGHNASRIVSGNGIAPTVKENHGTVTAVVETYTGVAVHPNSKKLEFNGFQDTECPALLATDYKAPKCVQYDNYRIRKLTPLECFRLQGFPDEFHDKAVAAGVSNSQLYKQAGNSITVHVIQAILKNLLK